MIRFIYIAFGFFLPLILSCQNVNINSLNQIINSEISVNQKTNALVQLSQYYVTKKPQKSLELASYCISLNKPEDVPISCFRLKSQAYYHLGKPDSSFFFTNIWIDIAKNRKDTVEIIKGLILKSDAATVLFLSDIGVKALEEAKLLAEKQNNLLLMAEVYENFGQLTSYLQSNNSQQSKIYLLDAEKIYSQLNVVSGLARINKSLAKISLDSLESISYYLKSLEYYKKLNDPISEGWLYFNIGIKYLNYKDYYKSLEYFNKALEIHESTETIGAVADELLCIGEINNLLNEPDNALVILERALSIALDIPLKPNIRDCYKEISRSYELKNDFAKAYKYIKLSHVINDSIKIERFNNQLTETNVKYESEKKETEIAKQELEIKLQKQSRSQILGGGIILFLLAGSIGTWYYQRQSARKKITELALANERLEKESLQEVDKMKTQFFTNVSHELKTPLTLVLGPLSNIIEKIDNTEIKRNILLAYNNAEKLNNLVNETLDLAMLEKGKIEIKASDRNIGKELMRTFLSFSSLAEMRDIKLEGHVHIPEDTCIRFDFEKLEKVVNNLVSNAIKFSRNGSRVEMNVFLDDKLRINITDHGTGIAKQEQAKIFNRFYQAKHNEYGSYGGTGIGLAFSKELAELLNGHLSVESELDKGSTFTFSVPVQVVETSLPYMKEDWSPVFPDDISYNPILFHGNKPNILIVEDNKDMQDYLNEILSEDYRCHFAVDGYEAIKKVQTHQFHLISSDVMMPNMDGFSLKKKINELKDYKNIPFIFLTARSLDDDILLGLNLGVDDYVTKPFNKKEYQVRIYNLLQNHKERMSAYEEFGSTEHTEDVDTQILKDAERSILKNLSNTEYKVAHLADDLHYSQRQLSRIIKQLTGLTPVNFILELRLQKAHQMIQSKAYTSISEVRYKIGIESASYFTRKFKERYGVSPSEI